jgi:HD-GYP domain-containing protein (c-di-GMP phosphodiesterase class II)
VTDIFNAQEETNSEDNNNNDAARQQADIFVAKLLDIKREDGSPKYESVEDALDALKASQEHIRNIEAENAQLKTKASESDQLKETLARLQENKNVNEEKPSDKTNTNGGLSEEAAAALIEKTLERKQQETAAINNIKSVQDQIIQKYGSREKAQEFIVNKSKELNISPEDLKTLSARSPNAALALLGEAVKPSTQINTSSVRLPNTTPTEDLKAPDVSLLAGRGATTKNQKDFIMRAKEKVYKELGITN